MPSNFRYVGIVVALALHNGILLPVRFPLALYKKILGIDVGLRDLEELDEELVATLEALREMRDRDEDVKNCGLTFTATVVEVTGSTEIPLREGGAGIEVTNDNLDEYIAEVVDFWLYKSVERQFDAFQDGFRKVIEFDEGFKMLQYDELDIILSGAIVFNWDDLRAYAIYSNGYHAESPVVLWFWEVFETLNNGEKRLFLRFVTGTDRSPVGGLAQVRLHIQRSGDTSKLPVAHTCFNILGLPDYPDQETLRRNLMTAIQWCEGFGFK
jgi:hypothetical protein